MWPKTAKFLTVEFQIDQNWSCISSTSTGVTILNYYFTDEDNCIIVEMSEIKIFILSTSVGNK